MEKLSLERLVDRRKLPGLRSWLVQNAAYLTFLAVFGYYMLALVGPPHEWFWPLLAVFLAPRLTSVLVLLFPSVRGADFPRRIGDFLGRSNTAGEFRVGLGAVLFFLGTLGLLRTLGILQKYRPDSHGIVLFGAAAASMSVVPLGLARLLGRAVDLAPPVPLLKDLGAGPTSQEEEGDSDPETRAALGALVLLCLVLGLGLAKRGLKKLRLRFLDRQHLAAWVGARRPDPSRVLRYFLAQTARAGLDQPSERLFAFLVKMVHDLAAVGEPTRHFLQGLGVSLGLPAEQVGQRLAPLKLAERMGRQEAAGLLGVPETAGPEEVESAFRRRLQSGRDDSRLAEWMAARLVLLHWRGAR